jgi:hypothetical protein
MQAQVIEKTEERELFENLNKEFQDQENEGEYPEFDDYAG